MVQHRFEHLLPALPCRQRSCMPRWTYMHISPAWLPNEYTSLSFERGTALALCHGTISMQEEPRSLLEGKMPLTWWKCIKLTGRVQVNVSLAAGGAVAACLPALQCDPGRFIEFCRWSSEKTRCPWQGCCHCELSILFYFFTKREGKRCGASCRTSKLLTLLSLKPSSESKQLLGR